jgi:transcriptional regulator with XRE-family HTH domain
VHDDLVRLNQYRLKKDLSFRALGQLTGIPERTLATVLTQADLQPWDRTLFKVQEFLRTLPPEDAAIVELPREATR